MSLNAAEIVIIAKDKYSAVVQKMQKTTRNFESSLKSSGNSLIKFGTRISKASTALANLRTGFAATMLGMGLKAVNKDAFLFSEAMNRVKKNTLANIPQMKMLADEAKRLNSETKFTAIQAAEMQAYLGQAGLDVKEIMALGPKVLTIATAGELSPEAAAKLLKTTLAAYSLDIDQAVNVIDDLAFAATNAQMTMTDLMNSLINVAGTAGAVDIPLKDTLAVLAGVAEKAELGPRAGTRLGMTIFSLVKAAGASQSKAGDALMKLGIPAKEIFAGPGKFKKGGLIRFFELLDEKGGTANDVLDIFTRRASRFTLKILGMSSGMREFRNRLDDTTVTGKAMSDIMMEGLYGSTTRATSAWINMKIAIGESLEFIMIPLQKIVKRFADWIKDRPKVAGFIGIFMAISFVLLTIVTILGVILASVGSLSIMFGYLAVSMGTATTIGAVGFVAVAAAMWAALWPVLLIVAGIALLVAGIVGLIVYWDEIVKFTDKYANIISIIVGIVALWLGPIVIIVYLVGLLASHWETIWGWVKKIGKVWGVIKGFFGGDTKHELTSTVISTEGLRSKSNNDVMVNIDGSIYVYDMTSGTVRLSANGGSVPLNIGVGGSW